MKEPRFDIISDADRAFILAFDKGMRALGYDCGGGIGVGYVWAKYQVIYAKTGVKKKVVAARIYIKENKIAIRLFFNNVNKHRTFIKNVPAHI